MSSPSDSIPAQQDSRYRLLRAARDILASTDDPAELTVARLSGRSGLSPTSLYRHFPSLEALTIEVALTEYAAFEARQAADLAPVSAPRDRLRRRLESGIEWALAYPGLYRCIHLAFKAPVMIEPYRSASSLRDIGIGPLIDDVVAVIADADPLSRGPDAVAERELRAAVLWTHTLGYVSTALDLPPTLRGREPVLRNVFLDLQLAALEPFTSSGEPAELRTAGGRRGETRAPAYPSPRERLLVAASALLDEHGETAAVTVRRLADAVGVSTGSVYLNFPDREAILVEVAETDRAAWLQLVDEQVSAIADPLERVMSRLRLDLRWAVERPLPFEILWLGARPASVHRSTDAGGAPEDGWATYVPDLAALVAGSGHTGDVEALAIGVWADLHGFLSMTLVTPDFPWPPAASLHRAFLRMEQTALTTLVGAPRGDAVNGVHRGGRRVLH